MKFQAQRLAVTGRLFPDILSGKKTSTIRWRERHIIPGRLTFFNEANHGQTVDVEAVRCTEMPLSEAASFLGRADEWPDQIMLDGMREHYPEIELSSIVQIVEFNASASH
ncbi:MAG: ASCH domain-containing protein [Pseudomonadota bacterium]